MAKNKMQERRSLILTILLILFLRGHLVEPFKIPSESMLPNILIGDHLFVSKSSYRIQLPFTNIELLRISEPQRGDVVVFHYPNYEQDNSKDGLYYIKRLIGVPGDQIKIVDGAPHINGVMAQQTLVTAAEFPNKWSPEYEPRYGTTNFYEKLPGPNGLHLIQRDDSLLEYLPAVKERFQVLEGRDCTPIASAFSNEPIDHHGMGFNNICTFEVPKDSFFVMGDNRDQSADGRQWGFVPRELMVGKALFIWLSCRQSDEGGGLCLLPWNWRWSRIGLPMR